MTSRRRFVSATGALAAAASAAGLVPRAIAQVLNRPLRLVVGFAAGGSTDVIARILAEKLRGSAAAQVLVDNRVGASGRIAVEYVKNADPDGSTLLFTPDFLMTVYPHSFRKLSYDPLRDFIPVANSSRSMLVLCAGPALPASITTLPELVQWARANPKLASYATTSPGATPHFTGVMLSRAANVELTPVHYKGGAPALQDLLGGQVPLSVNPVGEALPHLRAGKLRALAVTGRQRSRFLPEVPTMVESGYRDIVIESWIGFFTTGKTPPETVARLNAAIGEALKTPEVAAGLEKFAVEVAISSPADFAAQVKADMERWGPVVKASGFTADE